MTQEEKELLFKDLSARMPYGVKVQCGDYLFTFDKDHMGIGMLYLESPKIILSGCYYGEDIKPYLFPLSSMTDEDHATYSKIWEDTGKTAYLEGCHHLICTIKAYKAANDYLLSKQYDTNGLIPKGLANNATGLNIY